MSNKHRYGEMVAKQKGPLIKGTAERNKRRMEENRPPHQPEKHKTPPT